MTIGHTSSPWIERTLYDPTFDGFIYRVLTTESANLIGCWLQDEDGGVVSYDSSQYGHHGVYTAVTLGQPSVPGLYISSAGYDGATSFNNVWSPALASMFNGNEGTILALAQVANAGVWADSTNRSIIDFRVDPNNYVFCRRGVANNTIEFVYRAGAVQEYQGTAGLSSLDFVSYAMTWSKDVDIVRYYIGGVSSGNPDTELGVWVGDIDSAQANIGAATIVPSAVWLGNLSIASTWNKALTPLDMADIHSLSVTVSLFAVGDSKTKYGEWVSYLIEDLGVATDGLALENPLRFAVNGYTVADMKAYVDNNLADTQGTPTRVCINLGTNDVQGVLVEVTWKLNYKSIIDSFRAKWPACSIYLAKAWRRAFDAECNTLAGWIDDIIADYTSGVSVGPDERIWLENGDNGVTYTTDGAHYNDAGENENAAQWLTVLGY